MIAKRSRYCRIVALLVLAGLATAAGPAAAQQPILIRVTNQLPPASTMTKGLELWKERVEKGTQGRVKVELYPSSQLFKDNEVIPAVQRKSIEAGLVVAGQFAAYDPTFAIFDLPGLFQSYPQAIRAVDGDLGRTLAARMNKLGVFPLYWALQGFVEIGTTKKALITPDDMKGLKLRVHSKELARMAQLLGASPTTIAASEVSMALSQGTVDGITTSISSFEARRWFEGAPLVTNDKFGLVAIVIIINAELWSGLPADIRAIVEQASKVASTSSTEAVVKEDAEIFERLRKAGVKVSQFHAAARADFEAKTQSMYEDFYKSTGDTGRAMIKSVQAAK